MNLGINAKPPVWFARLGSHAEKDVFEGASGLVDGVALNANLVEGTPGGTFGLLWRTGDGSSAMPYFIEPMVYSFALPPHYLRSEQKIRGTNRYESRIRRTFRDLSQKYGGAIEEKAGTHSVVPEDYSDPDAVAQLTRAVLEYQYSVLEQQNSDSQDFVPPTAPETRPTVVIPPYFCMLATVTSQWLSLNIDFIKSAIGVDLNVPVYPVICIERGVLQDTNSLSQITRDYAAVQCPGYFIWVSGLAEQDVSPAELEGLRSLVEGLSDQGADVLGYFSGALGLALGMTGIVHAIGYGESKDIEPVLGGGPVRARFYFPPLKQLIPFRQARDYVANMTKNEYERTVCDCAVCDGLIQDNVSESFEIYGELETRGTPPNTYEIQTKRSIEASRLHFAAKRFKEIESIRNGGVEPFINDLRTDHDSLRGLLGLSTVRHLAVWHDGTAGS